MANILLLAGLSLVLLALLPIKKAGGMEVGEQQNRRRLLIGGVPLCLLGVLLQPGTVDVVRDILPGPRPPVHLLRAVESRMTTTYEDDTPRRFDDLASFFADANPELTRRVQGVVEGRLAPPTVTYLMGQAGLGKSFALAQVHESVADSSHVCTIDLRDLLDGRRDAHHLTVVGRADLVSTRGVEFNSLPALDPDSAFDFERLLGDAGCVDAGGPRRIVLIDDLDEVHKESALRVLEEVETAASTRSVPSHFIVAGRPEAFRPWFISPRRRSAAISRTIPLRGVTHSSKDELGFRYAEYLRFALPDRPVTEADQEAFADWIAARPFLSYTIPILAAAGFATEQFLREQDVSEDALKRFLYDNLMLRNRETHDRPDSEHRIYQQLLEAVAVKYVSEVDSLGFFPVLSNDHVVFLGADGVEDDVLVTDLLDLSGVALLNPADLTTPQYRFEPFWIHRFLVEEMEQRGR